MFLALFTTVCVLFLYTRVIYDFAYHRGWDAGFEKCRDTTVGFFDEVKEKIKQKITDFENLDK